MRSIAMPELYPSLHQYLLPSLPDECDTRLTNLIYLMLGSFQAGSVHLNLIARKTSVRAKKLSIVKRLARFLDNACVRVRHWYHPFAQPMLQAAAQTGQVHLIMDASKVAFGFRLLMVSRAYHKPSLPIAWTWVLGSPGHSTTATQVTLLEYVNRLLPRGARVSLVGDSEFGRPLLIENLTFWGWEYALRQPGDHLVMLRATGQWQRMDSLSLSRGQLIWIGHLVLTKASAYPTHRVLYWQKGANKPWYLATNRLDPRQVVRLYQRRMWIEEMFGDMKRHGFDLEASHRRHFLRLSRLTLAVCLLYIWLVAMAEMVITTDQTDEVDRHDRRDFKHFSSRLRLRGASINPL